AGRRGRWSGDCFLFQAEGGIRDRNVTGVQTCALPISKGVAICTLNLEDELWTENRPPLPATPAWLLPAACAGATPAEKLARLRRSEARRVGKGSSSRSPTTTQKRTESRAHRTTEPETS